MINKGDYLIYFRFTPSRVTMNITKDDVESSANPAISLTRDLLAVIAFLTIVTVVLLVRSYLNSVSFAKQCLLLYLYKDFASAISWMRFFWVIEVILSNWNAFETKKWEAIAIAFGIWSGALYMALVLNIICFLKFYMTKTGLIDPPIPWMGENDESAIKRIRAACCFIVTAFLSVSFGLGLYPNVYYNIDPIEQSNLSTNNLLYRGTSMILLLTFVVTSLAIKLYKATNEPQIVQIDSVIPWTVNFIVGTLLLMVGLLTLAELLQILNFETRWKGYQISMSTLQIIVPPAVILKSKQLKSHSARCLKNKVDDLFLMSIYFVPAVVFVSIYFTLYIFY